MSSTEKQGLHSPSQAELIEQVESLRQELADLRLNQLSHEQAFKENNALLTAILEGSTDAIFIRDREGRFQMVNQAGAKFLGRPVQEVIGKDAAELFCLETASNILEGDRRVIEEGVAQTVEVTAEAAGIPRTYLSTSFPYRDLHGNMIGLARIFKDISERKNAEEELRRTQEELEEQVVKRTAGLEAAKVYSEAEIADRQGAEKKLPLYKEIFAHSNEAIAILDTEGRYVEQNQAHASLLGYSDDDLRGQTPAIHLGDRAFSAIAQELAETGRYKGEIPSRTKEGNTAHLDLSVLAVRDDAGIPTCYVVLNRDITEHKRVEHTLRLQAQIMENMAEGVCLIRIADGMIVYANPTYESMFGYDSGELVGKHIRITNAPYDQYLEEAAHEIIQRFKEIGISRGELYNIKKNGVTFWSHANVSTFDHAEYGEVLVTVQEDITERKQVEEALQHIAAGVSASTGEAFFRSLVQYLAQTLDAEYAFIGELSEPTDKRITTIAAWAHGTIVPNFEYDLANTPCENVVGKRLCCYPSGVRELFPHDHLLVTMKVESYIGTPLFNSDGRALGIMVILGTRPMSKSMIAESMLQIFAVRASSELERRHAEAALRKSELHAHEQFTELNQIYQTAPIGLAFMDTELRYCRINEQLAAINGLPAGNHIGRTVRDVLPELADKIEITCRGVIETQRPVLDIDVHGITAADSTKERDWLTSYYPVFGNGKLLGISVVVQEITERKQAEEALRNSERWLRKLLEDRERLSQDLHDGILQTLYSVALGFDTTQLLLKNSPGKASIQMDQAVCRLNSVVHEIRSFVANLTPDFLHGKNLKTALQDMVHSLGEAYPVHLRTHLSPVAAAKVSQEHAPYLLNIAREALSNSLRHAGARNSLVWLRTWKGFVRLEVHDDGNGFNPNATPNSGRGLSNMKARAEKIGGLLHVHSKPGRGTRIVLDLPMEVPNGRG